MAVPDKQVWCDQIAEQCWSDIEATKKPSIYDRYLAMQVEMGRLKDDSSKPQGKKQITFHSIDKVEAEVNRLSFKYRVMIHPSMTDLRYEDSITTQVQKNERGYITNIIGDTHKPIVIHRISLHFINIDVPSQFIFWEWGDDGDDATKAGSFDVKYAYLKFFHVNDGSNEELTDSKVGGRWTPQPQPTPPPAQSRATSTAVPAAQAQQKPNLTVVPPQETVTNVPVSEIPPNGEAKKEEPKKEAITPEQREQRIRALDFYATSIPEGDSEKQNWTHTRIITELSLFLKRERDGTLNATDRQYGDPFRLVFSKLRKIHERTCGEKCPHQNPVVSVFKLGGEIKDYVAATSS